jgi:hypothetical protein
MGIMNIGVEPVEPQGNRIIRNYPAFTKEKRP